MQTKKEIADKYPLQANVITRLKVMLSDEKITQKEFCKQTGINATHLARVMSGGGILSGDMLLRIAKAGYDMNMLLSGKTDHTDKTILETEISRLKIIVDELFNRINGKK